MLKTLMSDILRSVCTLLKQQLAGWVAVFIPARLWQSPGVPAAPAAPTPVAMPLGLAGLAAFKAALEEEYPELLLDGMCQTEDSTEEERKQKVFGRLLNAMTPDNCETLHNSIMSVGISSAATLRGLIDQVYDKAMSEPETCATLCFNLQRELPAFPDEAGEEGGADISFRRLLLNKCQEEFEEGDAAMAAVERRERAQQERDAAGKPKEEEKENGEIMARQRALGNIQFIGFLYKKKMLTEKIMHSCIVRLMNDADNPKPEDVECLCKLLATIGHLLDASARGHVVMDAYFMRMMKIGQGPGLETRHRYLIKDLVELRNRNWVARRKVEGPMSAGHFHLHAHAAATSTDNYIVQYIMP